MSLKNNLTLSILEKAEREGCTFRFQLHLLYSPKLTLLQMPSLDNPCMFYVELISSTKTDPPNIAMI